ncbi:MAG: biotin carboxyl carrier protein of acetyl-CoA carboxylase 2, chloroplastic-like [Chloroflexota bacterium]|jgi:acetyl-CoA carboxylase biotin carboxyl carrier protein|nr:biotin carboxyl carrier protein of acetyl-CoA carboxylase 2, chloroplastic-like [Chloroflexota bacterium]
MTDDISQPTETPEVAATGASPASVPAADQREAAPLRADEDLELLELIDRLAALLDRSDLTELEVEAGGTGLVLRKPSAIAPSAGALSAPALATTDSPPTATGEPPTPGREPAATAKPSIKAPLTGIFYASPAPGSAPYVTAGGEVAVGQIIGLIEAMKLFNEIKSDLAGRVVRVVPESGTLVKAKQPLIEVEPL